MRGAGSAGDCVAPGRVEAGAAGNEIDCAADGGPRTSLASNVDRRIIVAVEYGEAAVCIDDAVKPVGTDMHAGDCNTALVIVWS